MSDLISRQAAIDELSQRYIIMDNPHYIGYNAGLDEAQKVIKALPPVQPNHNADPGKMEIVRCKDCKHWNLQVGNVKGDGLGSCDFHNVNLVTGEGFCYWADRRGESE